MASKTKSRKSRKRPLLKKRTTAAADRGSETKTKRQRRRQTHPEEPTVIGSGNSEPPNDTPLSLTDEEVDNLLSPYSKDQLIAFLSEAAASDAVLLSKIRAVADKDVSQRKIFVYGLGWDVTHDDLVETFSPFGKIEECNVVVDKVIGRTKGYGFVLFGDRAGATKALKQPQKKIRSRVASCQFASIGPVSSGGAMGAGDTAARKIYVSNVNADVKSDKLREFFAKFGAIETGPLGFDMVTGRSRGFALFVYKTVEGARKALEEPHKMFQGHQLHCLEAVESSGKGKGLAGVVGPATIPTQGSAAVSAGSGVLGAGASQPVLAAVAAAQNLSLINWNPTYGMLLSQNPLMAAALGQSALTQGGLNPAAAAALTPSLNQLGGTGVMRPFQVLTGLRNQWVCKECRLGNLRWVDQLALMVKCGLISEFGLWREAYLADIFALEIEADEAYVINMSPSYGGLQKNHLLNMKEGFFLEVLLNIF